MSLTLTYPRHIPAPEIVGRLLGPDTTGRALVQVVAVEHTEDGATRAKCRPVGPGQDHLMTRDEFGQWWLPLPTEVTG